MRQEESIDLPVQQISSDVGKVNIASRGPTGLELVGVGEELGVVTIEIGQWPDSELRVRVGTALERLVILATANRSWNSPGSLTLVSESGGSVSVEGKIAFSAWNLAGGEWSISLPNGDVANLSLADASLRQASLSQALDTVSCKGGVSIDGKLKARLGKLDGEDPVELLGQWQIDEVAAQPDSTRHLIVGNGATLTTRKLSDIHHIELYGSVTLTRPIRGAKNVLVEGYGSLVLQDGASVENVRFKSPKEPTGLGLNRDSKAVSISGAVRLLRAKKGALLSGNRTTPVSVVGLDHVEECVLSGIDLSGLQLSDFPALEEPSVLDPWMATTRAASIEIERREGLYKKGFDSPWKRYWAMAKRWAMNLAVLRKDWPEPPFYPADLRQRLAERWVQISRVVSGEQVSSATQSRIRYAAQHWRRKSLHWRWGQLREKLLVTGYWVIGYGERILRPLMIYVLFAALLGALMTPDLFPHGQGSTTGSRIEYLLLAPLSVLRVAEGVMSGEHWVIPLLRLFGLLAVGIALLAARRIARAD